MLPRKKGRAPRFCDDLTFVRVIDPKEPGARSGLSAAAPGADRHLACLARRACPSGRRPLIEESVVRHTRSDQRSELARALAAVALSLAVASTSLASGPDYSSTLGSWGADPRLVRADDIPIELDQEHSLGDRILNPSTQSINRYHSLLRELDRVDAALDPATRRLSLWLHNEAEDAGRGVRLDNLDIKFLAPVLPYASSARLRTTGRRSIGCTPTPTFSDQPHGVDTAPTEE